MDSGVLSHLALAMYMQGKVKSGVLTIEAAWVD